MKEKVRSLLLGAICIGVIIIIWGVASATGIFGKYSVQQGQLLLPSPLYVLRRFGELIVNGYLVKHIWISMQRVLLGFFIASVLGIVLGVSMGKNKWVYYFLSPIFRILAPIPGVAWVPLAILWFGLGNDSAIFIIVVSSVTPVVLNTIQGVQSVDPALSNVMSILNANYLQKLKYLIIPNMMPYLYTGLKVSLSFSWRVVIAAEMVGVSNGLGYVLNYGRSTAQTEITFITIIILCMMMAMMEKLLFNPLERRINRLNKEI